VPARDWLTFEPLSRSRDDLVMVKVERTSGLPIGFSQRFLRLFRKAFLELRALKDCHAGETLQRTLSPKAASDVEP